MEYREFCCMVMATVLGATLAAGDAGAQVAGFTPGEFSVDPTGAATYRIPLEVPPGAAGMQPELALLCHSRAGNGQLGVGWSVCGRLARCRDTTAKSPKETAS